MKKFFEIVHELVEGNWKKTDAEPAQVELDEAEAARRNSKFVRTGIQYDPVEQTESAPVVDIQPALSDENIAKLSDYILAEYPDSIKDGGAVDVAIEIMKAAKEKDDVIADLKKAYEDENQKSINLQSSLDDANDNLSESSKTISEQTTQIDSLKEELAAAQKDAEEKAALIGDKQAEIDQLKTEIEGFKKDQAAE